MAEDFIIAKEPRLHWRSLLPIRRRRPKQDWHEGRSVYALFLARNGIFHGLTALGIQPGDNVLVPAFHCAATVDPILAYGGCVKYYDVNLDLSPNVTDLIDKIDRQTRAILIIHYFGFPQPVQKIRELCDKRKLFLIEDCAHVLTGKTNDGIELGISGDISVFSWRKFLPINDGAALVINNRKVTLKLAWQRGGLLFRLKTFKNTLERLSGQSSSIQNDRNSFASLLRAYLTKNSTLSVVDDAAVGLSANTHQTDFNLDLVNFPMSKVAQLIYDNTDSAAIAEARQRNYRKILRALDSLTGVMAIYSEMTPNICPWVFPIFSRTIKDLHVKLRAAGLPATTWGGVIHPSLQLQCFPNARTLYDQLVFLPIHQSLSDRDLDKMISILRDTLTDKAVVHAECVNDRVSLPAL